MACDAKPVASSALFQPLASCMNSYANLVGPGSEGGEFFECCISSRHIVYVFKKERALLLNEA